MQGGEKGRGRTEEMITETNGGEDIGGIVRRRQTTTSNFHHHVHHLDRCVCEGIHIQSSAPSGGVRGSSAFTGTGEVISVFV